MPHNDRLEQVVLGCLAVEEDRNVLRQMAFRLTDEDFFNPRHKKIFEVIIQLLVKNEKFDLVILTATIPEQEQYLLQITVDLATTAQLEDYIVQLKKITAKRKAISLYALKVGDLYEADEPLESICELADEMAKIYRSYRPKKHFSTSDSIENVYSLVKDCQGNYSDFIVKYMIPVLDNKLIHVRKQMHVLASRPGIGKTALALSSMRQQIPAGMKVALFCGESSKEELILRMISIMTRKPFIWYIQGMPGATSEDVYTYNEALNRLRQFKDSFWIYGKGDFEHSPQGVADIMTVLTQKNGRLDMIWIDYLQNMVAPAHLKRTDKTHLVTEYNVQQTNELIGEFDVAGVLLCQINRQARGRRPYMDDLKNSSTIEQEAHIITFLHRENNVVDEDGIAKTEWYGDKARVLGKFFTNLAFHAKRAEYTGLMSTDYCNDPSLDGNVRSSE